MKKNIIFTIILFVSSLVFADPFNKRLTSEERELLASGEVLIKNINYERNMCLEENFSELSDELLNTTAYFFL